MLPGKMVRYNGKALSTGSTRYIAHVAQSVERVLGKDEVHRFDPGRGLHVRNYMLFTFYLGYSKEYFWLEGAVASQGG